MADELGTSSSWAREGNRPGTCNNDGSHADLARRFAVPNIEASRDLLLDGKSRVWREQQHQSGGRPVYILSASHKSFCCCQRTVFLPDTWNG